MRLVARAVPRPLQIDVPGFAISGGDFVVDVGCGGGDVCAYAGSLGADVVGIDAEPLMVQQTTKAMRGQPARSFRGLVSDCAPIPLPDAVASVVVCTEVLEHVPDPAALLAELARIGRPGARYLLSVPDPASEGVMKAVAPAWYWEPPIHIRVFDHATLDRLVEAAGLAIASRHASGFYWSIWWALRMALGMDHKYAEAPDDPVFHAWDKTVARLKDTPHGPEVLRALDRALPKSQVIVAVKPAA